MGGSIGRRCVMCFAVTAAVLQLAVVAPAGAQDNEIQAEYHVKRGRIFFKDSQYAEAISEFDSAYALNPNYEYLPDIAKIHEALKNYGRAIDAYEAYLRKGARQLRAAERKNAKAEIKRLRREMKGAANKGLARKHYEAGYKYNEKGKLGLALIEFERAYQLTHDPAYLYNIGTVHIGNGDTGLAAEAFRQFLDESGAKIPAADRAEIEQKIAQLEGSQTPAPVPAKPEVRESIRRLNGGVPQPQPGAPRPVVPGEPAEPGGRVWTWVFFGIGGAAAIGAGITGSLALTKEKDVRSKCNGITCPESTIDDINAIQTLGPLTDVLIGVAAAGVLAGVVAYFVEDDGESATTVALTPSSAGGGVVTVGGRF